jgi:hypothetical protein
MDGFRSSLIAPLNLACIHRTLPHRDSKQRVTSDLIRMTDIHRSVNVLCSCRTLTLCSEHARAKDDRYLSGDLFRDQIDSACTTSLLSSYLREITTRKDDIDIFPLPISLALGTPNSPNSQFSPGSHAHGRGLPPLTHSGTHTSHIRSPPPSPPVIYVWLQSG